MHDLSHVAQFFNRPKFCSNASWNPRGTVFKFPRAGPHGLFVTINDTVYAAEQNANRIQV
jgi:hypothetical protein